MFFFFFDGKLGDGRGGEGGFFLGMNEWIDGMFEESIQQMSNDGAGFFPKYAGGEEGRDGVYLCLMSRVNASSASAERKINYLYPGIIFFFLFFLFVCGEFL